MPIPRVPTRLEPAECNPVCVAIGRSPRQIESRLSGPDWLGPLEQHVCQWRSRSRLGVWEQMEPEGQTGPLRLGPRAASRL